MAAHPLDLDLKQLSAGHQRAIRQVDDTGVASSVQMGADGAVHPTLFLQVLDDLPSTAAHFFRHLEAEIDLAGQGHQRQPGGNL